MINKLYAIIQLDFSMKELKKIWTVSKEKSVKSPNSKQAVTNCRPAAYPRAFKSVEDLAKMFGSSTIAVQRWGYLTNIAVEFIEGETGNYYFSKIKSFETSGL